MTQLGIRYARTSQSVLGRRILLIGETSICFTGEQRFTKEGITRFTWGNKQITYCQPGDNVQGKQKATLPIISLVITEVIWNEDSFTDYQLSDRHEKSNETSEFE